MAVAPGDTGGVSVRELNQLEALIRSSAEMLVPPTAAAKLNAIVASARQKAQGK